MIASPLSVLVQVYPSPGQSDVPVDTVLKMKFTEADSNVLANSGYTVTLKGFERDCTTQKDTATRLVSLTATDGSTVVNEMDGEKKLTIKSYDCKYDRDCVCANLYGVKFTDHLASEARRLCAQRPS